MSRFIAFDVETPNYQNNRMSAIGITVIEDGSIVDEYYYWTLDPKVGDTDLINRAKLSDFEFVDVDGRKIVRRRKQGR